MSYDSNTFFIMRRLTDWVVRSYDDFAFGRASDLRRLPDGGLVPGSGGLYEIFASQRPLTHEPTGSVVTVSGPVLYPPVHPEAPTNERDPIARLTPREALIRSLSYRLHVRVFFYVNGHKNHFSTFVGWLPFVVGSRHFRDEDGSDDDTPGYFIVKGREVAIVNQEEFKYDRPLISMPSPGCFECEVRSSLCKFVARLAPYRGVVVEMSSHAQKGFLVQDLLYVLGEREVTFSEESERVRHVLNVSQWKTSPSPHHVLGSSFAHGMDHGEETNKERVDEILRDKLFASFLGSDYEQKIHYLKRVVVALAECAIREEERKPDEKNEHLTDKLQYENKCTRTCGALLYELTAKAMQCQMSDLEKHLRTRKKCSPDETMKRHGGKFTSVLELAMNTGNWVRGRTGIVQSVRRRDSHGRAAQIMRKINIPIVRNTRNLETKFVHGSQLGFVCVATTPEGEDVGLVVNPAVSASVTVAGDADECVRSWMQPLCSRTRGRISCYVNERWVGFCSEETWERARRYKRDIWPETSVYRDGKGNVFLDLTACRLVRPLLLRPEAYDAKRDFGELIRDGIVEWVDAREQRDAVVYERETREPLPKPYTHAELHPSYILNPDAGRIVFSNRNEAPRVLLGACMSAASIGVPTFSESWDTSDLRFRLQYPQRPLVDTIIGKQVGSQSIPQGQNVVMMILALDRNQEDSVVFSQRFNDFAGFRIVGETCHSMVAPAHCTFGAVRGLRDAKRDADGIVAIGARVADGDVLATLVRRDNGKYVGEFVYRDVALGSKTFDEPADDLPDCDGATYDRRPGGETKYRIGFSSQGFIETKAGVDAYGNEYFELRGRGGRPNDPRPLTQTASASYAYRVRDVVLTVDENNQDKLIVKVVHERRNFMGDKFTSRHSQKGTIGAVWPTEDLPYTVKDGITPDVILNPHAIPSRMTIGHLLELMTGKVTSLGNVSPDHALDGDQTTFDGTPFRAKDDEVLSYARSALRESGYEPNGTERVMDGRTGLMLDAEVFTGVIHLQRLTHMPADKIHARSTGPNSLTKQPMRGKKRRGGARFGEMEVHALESHGASMCLSDKLLRCSDGVRVGICEDCGNAMEDDVSDCRLCGGRTHGMEVSNGLLRVQQDLNCCRIDFQVRKISRNQHGNDE